jgi:hypothetical protein
MPYYNCPGEMPHAPSVSKLLDTEGRGWDHDRIKAVFNAEDADNIVRLGPRESLEALRYYMAQETYHLYKKEWPEI